MAETPIAGLRGIELERSFLMSLQEWHRAMRELEEIVVTALTPESVEKMVRDLMTRSNNLDQLIARIEEGEHRHA